MLFKCAAFSGGCIFHCCWKKLWDLLAGCECCVVTFQSNSMALFAIANHITARPSTSDVCKCNCNFYGLIHHSDSLGGGGVQLRPICHSAKAGIHPGQVASLSWGQLFISIQVILPKSSA